MRHAMGRPGPHLLRELDVERLRLPRGDFLRRAEMRHREDEEPDGWARGVPRRAQGARHGSPARWARDHQRGTGQDGKEGKRGSTARRLRHRAHRADGGEARRGHLGRLSGRRCAGVLVRDARLDPPQADRRDRSRHLGLRGAAERDRAGHQSALALDHDPDHGPDDGRDLLSRRARHGLRGGRRLRVPVRRAGDSHYRRGGLADQSAGDQMKASGAQILAEMLAGYGVSHVFMVPAVLRRTFAEMERRTSIRRIHTHGEKAAAYMADGYARASGKPGVCMAQVVGALNLAAGLRDAWLAHSPVIAFTGGRRSKTKFRKVYKEIDDIPAFEPVTKLNATVDDAARFPDMVRQAFRVAVSGCPGPVHLQFRGNEGQIDAEEAELEPLVEPIFARVPPFRPEPDRPSILAALELLQQAQRPVIVAGGG